MAAGSKSTFPTVFVRTMSYADKEAVRDAISDWRPDGVQMTDDEATTIFTQWVEQQRADQETFSNAQGTADERKVDPDGRTWVYEVICLRSNDTVIGFQMGKFIGTRFHQSMVAIRPAYRGNGYYTELSQQGLKTLFLESVGLVNVETFTSNVPLKAGILPAAVYDIYNGGDDDWSYGVLRTQTLLDRIDPTEYKLVEIKKSDWLTWLDLSAQAAIKAAHFTYEVYT